MNEIKGACKLYAMACTDAGVLVKRSESLAALLYT